MANEARGDKKRPVEGDNETNAKKAKTKTKKKKKQFFLEFTWIQEQELEHSRAIRANNEIGHNEYRFDISLVDRKFENRKVYVTIEVDFWIYGVDLEHLNLNSMVTADFCKNLWEAAGRDTREYNEIGIERGRSIHSDVEIRDLVEETIGIYRKDALYIRSVKENRRGSWKASIRLLDLLLDKLDVLAFAHRSVDADNSDRVESSPIGNEWFVMNSRET